MANFSPLTAEIDRHIWGTPANINGFCGIFAKLWKFFPGSATN